MGTFLYFTFQAVSLHLRLKGVRVNYNARTVLNGRLSLHAISKPIKYILPASAVTHNTVNFFKSSLEENNTHSMCEEIRPLNAKVMIFELAFRY